MENTKKTYWKGLEELTKNPEFEKNAEKEFPEYLPISGESEGSGASRRDFLKLMGFGVAAASLAACETPIRKAIPYLNKPVDIDPGVPNYYASTYVNGNDYCSIVVKAREGRPIKIDGNKLSSVSGGGTSAQAQASVLSLYDKQRLTAPQIGGNTVTWDELDKEVASKLAEAGSIALVTSSIFSPSTLAAIEVLKAKYPSIEVVEYDQVSFSGVLAANEASFGKKAVPSYDFSQADTIVTFGADFLGGWLNGTLHSKQFAKTRKLGSDKKKMSRLYAFESNLSLTGSNADYRTAIKPSQQSAYIANLYNALASKAGLASVTAPKVGDSANLTKAANDLWASKGKSLVVSGSNDTNVQIIVNAINNLLGCYGTTIDLSKSVNTRKGDDTQITNFIKNLNAGKYGGVLFFNCNPVYDHAMGAQIAAGISKAKFTLSTSDRKDETAALVNAIAPDHHYLESWNDFEPVTGQFSFSQPTISPLFKTRQAQESFLVWGGISDSYFDFVKSRWTAEMSGDTQASWDKLLQDGVKATGVAATEVSFVADVNQAAAGITASGSEIELSIYENYSVGNGTQANNPWLQEMPDPITKAVWDNYVTISASMAQDLGLQLGDMTTQLVTLTVGSNAPIKVPAVVQPGQAIGTIGLALGYGRTSAGKVADNVGVNAYPLVDYSKGFQNTSISSGVKLELSGEEYRVAQTQTHQTYMGRENVIQESILSKYQKDASAGRFNPMISTYNGKKKPGAISLWSGHAYPNHHWGMTIDLNSCTGCGACTVSCQAENNVPVVGKEEVLNRREMSWLRIDRYYSSDAKDDLKDMEIASAVNPEVTFQPMMCQQCNNAPCETVCPVAATNHSTEGLNQMAYNRCIGTRYCANNCPYKVRRFNWFKYHDNDKFPENTSMNNDLGKMVLNPDVTVRARGVMEKCSFCVQRIQSGKLNAKQQGRRPIDGEITSACASACPSEAIVFGDLKDPNSRISQLLKIQEVEMEDGKKTLEVQEERAYHVLEELAVKPNVWYFTKIRNKEENEA